MRRETIVFLKWSNFEDHLISCSHFKVPELRPTLLLSLWWWLPWPHLLSPTCCNSTSCVDVNHDDLRTWGALGLSLMLPVCQWSLLIHDDLGCWYLRGACPCSAPLRRLHHLPTLPLAAPLLGHDELQLMFSARSRAWDQSTCRRLGSALRWLGRAVWEGGCGVSVSSAWLELPPIHSGFSRGRTWSCEATCNLWITTARHKQWG